MKNKSYSWVYFVFGVIMYFFLLNSNFMRSSDEKKLSDTIETEFNVIMDLHFQHSEEILKGDYITADSIQAELNQKTSKYIEHSRAYLELVKKK